MCACVFSDDVESFRLAMRPRACTHTLPATRPHTHARTHARTRARAHTHTHHHHHHQFCAQRAVLDQDTPPTRPSAYVAEAVAGAGEHPVDNGHPVDNETGNDGDVTREAGADGQEQWQRAAAGRRQGHRNEHAAGQDVAHVRDLAAAGKLHTHPTFCFEGAELAQVCWSQCVFKCFFCFEARS